MLAMRSSTRFIEILPSVCASGAPGHECAPRPKATCSRTLGRSCWN